MHHSCSLLTLIVVVASSANDKLLPFSFFANPPRRRRFLPLWRNVSYVWPNAVYVCVL